MCEGFFMFNSIQYVRNLCKQKDIAIARLEKDCGFSNGYLNSKKQSKLPYDRAVKIAEYLDVPVEEILSGPSAKKESPSEFELTEGEKAFIELLRKLTPEDRLASFEDALIRYKKVSSD